jgi:hypothetical protein
MIVFFIFQDYFEKTDDKRVLEVMRKYFKCNSKKTSPHCQRRIRPVLVAFNRIVSDQLERRRGHDVWHGCLLCPAVVLSRIASWKAEPLQFLIISG